MSGLPSNGESEAATRPRQFGQYAIVREMGRGGMATVFEAVHASLGKRVALKVMHVDVRERPNAAARFFREARAAAQIRHQHVVNVFDVGTEAGTPFIVMDLVDGMDLADWLASKGKLSIRPIAELFLPIASAVWSAHRAGIVHRDLKPSNILVCEFPRGVLHPTVVDFGISKSLDAADVEPLTRSESLLGTPHYMAPEQIRGAKFVTERADQYALGVMLYECATGKRPFEGSSAYDLMHAIATIPVTKPTQLDPSISREFETVVLRAMHRDPSKRFPSVQALGCALLSFAGKEGWSNWGLEFSGSALGASVPLPGGSVRGTVADGPAVPIDTPFEERKSAPSSASQDRRLASKKWTGATLSILALLAALGAMRFGRLRTDHNEAIATDEIRTTNATPPGAPTEFAAIPATPPNPDRQVETPPSPETDLAPSNVLIPPKPAQKLKSVPRVAPPASSASEPPKPAPESRTSRERGQNGALILE